MIFMFTPSLPLLVCIIYSLRSIKKIQTTKDQCILTMEPYLLDTLSPVFVVYFARASHILAVLLVWEAWFYLGTVRERYHGLISQITNFWTPDEKLNCVKCNLAKCQNCHATDTHNARPYCFCFHCNKIIRNSNSWISSAYFLNVNCILRPILA